jgi:DNA polymerase I-like protein with 3'-5' exonuclease and polymerase domains
MVDPTAPYLAADAETDDLADNLGATRVAWTVSDGTYSEFHTDDPPAYGHLYAHNISFDAPLLGINLDDPTRWDDTMAMGHNLRGVLGLQFVGLKRSDGQGLGQVLAGVEWPCSIRDLLREQRLHPHTEDHGVNWDATKQRWVAYAEFGGWRRTKSHLTEEAAWNDVMRLHGVVRALEPKPAVYKWHPVPFSQAMVTRRQECEDYATTDAYATSLLARELDGLLDQYPWARDHYENVDKPVIPALAQMMHTGVRVDTDALDRAATVIERAREEAEVRLRGVFGEDVNLASGQQMGPLLWQMGIVDGKLTDSGGIGTAEDNILAAFRVEKVDDLPDTDEARCAADLLEWRKMGKLKSTYLEPLREMRDPAGRVHARFKLEGTTVSRLSSADPNLQNIPSRTKVGKSIREAIVPAPGNALVGGDFGQLQPRVWAKITGDPTFLAAYCTPGVKPDIYLPVARELDLRNYDGETDRQAAKPVVLGAMYQGGPATLARAAKVPESEMDAFLNRLYERLPSIRTWPQTVERILRDQGYVESLLGWRMYFPDYHSAQFWKVSRALRQAANGPIIATEGDIVKVVMAAVYRELRAEFPSWRLVLQVHDEILAEGPERDAEAVAAMMSDVAQSVPRQWLDPVPVTFDAKPIQKWSDLK